MNIENGTLIVNGHSVELKPVASDAIVRVWAVPSEYRESGLFIAVDLPDQPPEIPACSLADTQYLGELDYPAYKPLQLSAAKTAQLARINESCELALSSLTSTYPPGELQSWPQQVLEATALQLESKGAAPLLTAIAEARGLPVADLALRVQAKAEGYAQLSGTIIGKRQAIEDLLALAETLEEVGAIVW